MSAGLREAIARGAMRSMTWFMAMLAGAWTRRASGFWTATRAFDALIFPAAPDIAPAGMKTGDPRFIVPFTAFGGPIVSIPVGFGAGGFRSG